MWKRFHIYEAIIFMYLSLYSNNYNFVTTCPILKIQKLTFSEFLTLLKEEKNQLVRGALSDAHRDKKLQVRDLKLEEIGT